MAKTDKKLSLEDPIPSKHELRSTIVRTLMSILKLSGLILGSALFFPVSCTTALFTGIEIQSFLFARDMSHGDKPYVPFYVLATVPTGITGPIEVSEVDTYIEKSPDISFLLAQQLGALPGEKSSRLKWVNWRVISSNSNEQLVEVNYLWGDTSFYNRYLAMRRSVSPVSSRMWYHGYMFTAFFPAIGFGLLVYWLGCYLRRKYVVRESDKANKWVATLVIICILSTVAVTQYIAYRNRKSRIKQEQAISDFNKALEINPKDAKAYFNRGLDYAKVGRYEQAILNFTKALEINPRDADAYFNRGDAYVEEDQYDQAIPDFTKALEINPGYACAYNNRGLAYKEKGQYDQAIPDFTKALEINPGDAWAYNNRGLAYKEKGQYDQAISDYTKALEINPGYACAYNNRGYAYYFQREYDKSWKDVEKAQDLGYWIDSKFLDDLRKASGRKN